MMTEAATTTAIDATTIHETITTSATVEATYTTADETTYSGKCYRSTVTRLPSIAQARGLRKINRLLMVTTNVNWFGNGVQIYGVDTID